MWFEVKRLAFVGAMTLAASVALGTEPVDGSSSRPLPIYYLRGYYQIDSQRPVWQQSDSAPWSQVKGDSPWVNKRIVKWGYVPFTHDSSNYYCLIDDKPATGTHVTETTFICGDPQIVESLFLQYNWKPNIPLIGGGPPLENSLRPKPSTAN